MSDRCRALLVVEVEIEPGFEDEFNRWYDEEHIPEKLADPGFISARRFASAEGPHRYLAVYELESADAATNPDYMSRRPSPWTERIMPHWVKWSRSVWNLREPADGQQ